MLHARGDGNMRLMLTSRREIGNYREDCEKLERDQRLHDSLWMKKVRWYTQTVLLRC